MRTARAIRPITRQFTGVRSSVFRPAIAQRAYFTAQHIPTQTSSSWKWISAGLLFGAGVSAAFATNYLAREVDYDAVRKAVADSLENLNYDDGSYGPVFVRLAWHQSGTYSKDEKNGGSNGASIRLEPESGHGANAGLHVARQELEKIKKKFPEISYADLYILASIVAIEEMGGPKINFIPGRSDISDTKLCPVDGRLPDASQGAAHVRHIFYRMGFNDREIVALVGAHVLGRCHTDRSGYSGPWTNSPTTFSNDYFVQLLENKWTPKKWNGPLQYEDKTGTLMMLPSDLALRDDPSFRKYVDLYAKDEDVFFADFAIAYEKLTNLGRYR